MNKKKLLALFLSCVMVLTMMPAFAVAEEVTGTLPSTGLKNAIPVTVDWSRSKEITDFIDPNDVYNDLDKANDDIAAQGAEARLIPIDRNTANPYDGNFTWDFLNSLGASESENVWDAQKDRIKYYDGCINGAQPGGEDAFGNNLYNNVPFSARYTSYHAATWMHAISRGQEGWGVPSVRRFQGTFDVNDALPDGEKLSNIYIGVDQSNPYGDLLMNDGMFVFVYPKGETITEDNYMDFLAYWATTPVNSATEFNGVAKLGTAYGYNAGSGDPDYDFVDGWHINVEEIPAWDVGEYANETDWVIDIFAIEVDRGGGMAAPSVFVNWEEGNVNGVFAIQKMVESEDGTPEAGGKDFTFNAYASIDENGEPVGEIVATATTGDDGVARFDSESIEPGTTYYVFEAMTAEQSLIYQFGAENPNGYIAVVAKENDDGLVDGEFFNDLIPPTGKLIIGKELGKKVNVSGSITGGYPAEAKPDAKGKYDHSKYAHSLAGQLKENGGSWFQFNEFNNRTGGTYDLVQGDKLNVVGGYTITYDGNGWFTIDFKDLTEGVGAKLSISNTILAAKNKNDKNFNVNNIWTTAPGQQQFSFSGDSYRFYAPWVDVSKTVYVYLHLDGITGYENTYGAVAGQTFTVLVTGPSFPNGEVFDVPMNGSIELENLKPGNYTVKEIESGWIATYYVNGDTVGVTGRSVTVFIKNGENTTVKMTNEPGVYPSGVIAIEKNVPTTESETGYWPAIGEEFEFAVYEQILNDMPVGEPIIRQKTNYLTDSIVMFKSDALIPGNTYYVFEVMSNEQSIMYMFGAANSKGYIEVVALDEKDAEFVPAIPFYNDFALGSLNVIDDVVEEYYIEYHTPVRLTEVLSDTFISDYESDYYAGNVGGGTGARQSFISFKVDDARNLPIKVGIVKHNTTKILGYYYVSVIGEQIVVSFDAQTIATLDAGIQSFDSHYSASTRGNGKPGGKDSNAIVGVLSGVNPSLSVPLLYDENGIAYLYLHASTIEYYTGEVTCTVSSTEGPLYRPFADATISVKIFKGEESEPVYEGSLGLIEDLLPGDYKVELYVNGNIYGTMTDTVTPGEKTTVDFGDVIVNRDGEPAIVIICSVCQ